MSYYMICYECVTRIIAHVIIYDIIWVSLVKHRSSMCDMTHSCSICIAHVMIWVAWLIHMCDMTHPYVWHDSSRCVTWLIHICLTWLIHMCERTHLCVSHGSFIFVTWLIHTCGLQLASVLINESCNTYEWVMTHVGERVSHVRSGRVTHVNESCNTCEWVMSHIWMSHVTHDWAHRTHEWVMSHMRVIL